MVVAAAAGEPDPSPPGWGRRENEKVKRGAESGEKKRQRDGATLVRGERRVREGKPKESQGPSGRKGAQISKGDTEKDGRREAGRVRNKSERKERQNEGKWKLRKEGEEGSLRR